MHGRLDADSSNHVAGSHGQRFRCHRFCCDRFCCDRFCGIRFCGGGTREIAAFGQGGKAGPAGDAIGRLHCDQPWQLIEDGPLYVSRGSLRL
ncbi:MAG: hypothetical protein QOG64_1896 [Acidimicrobiaceae bacterium]|nr:hypothetical protein [Acidimicrobiaceae bacterium]